MNKFIERAGRLLNLNDYSEVSTPIPYGNREFVNPLEKQYVLRMLVKSPETNGFYIPPSLEWLKDTIVELEKNQHNLGFDNPFVYVTVRHGFVESETDDAWHVDGFSMRVPHVPEQNYIWSNCHPTEYVDQSFPIPSAFDPFVHNLHSFLGKNVKQENVKKCDPNTIYLIDPYCVHRRQPGINRMMRTFWRVSFIPIEIEDDTCSPNPLLRAKKYGRTDIRKKLVDFVG